MRLTVLSDDELSKKRLNDRCEGYFIIIETMSSVRRLIVSHAGSTLIDSVTIVENWPI